MTPKVRKKSPKTSATSRGAMRLVRSTPKKGPRVVKRGTRAVAAIRESATEYGPLLGFLAITAATAALGARFNPGPRNADTQLWYDAQKKSPLNPPPQVFGPVWTALYGMIAVAGWRVYRAPLSRARTQALVWWAAQMSLNAAWTPLFFGEQMPRAALADLIAMAASIGGFTATARKVDRTASALMIPYLGWVTFAGYLNAEIVRRNRDVTPAELLATLEGV